MDPCCHDVGKLCQVESYHYRGESRSMCLDFQIKIADDCDDHGKLPRLCIRNGFYEKFKCCDGEEVDAEGVNSGLPQCSKSEDNRIDLLSCSPETYPLKIIVPILIISAIIILLIFLCACRRCRARRSPNTNSVIVTGAPPPIMVPREPFLSGAQPSTVCGASPSKTVFHSNQHKEQIPLAPMEQLPPSYEEACQ